MRLTSGLLLIATALTAAVSAQSQCTSRIVTVQGSVRSYQMADNPEMPHSPEWGWERLAQGNTEVCFANLYRNIKIFPGSSATVPIYESNDIVPSQVTRVVLGVQAKGADSWHYWTNLANTRNKAWGNNAGFDKSKVSVVVPQFIRQQDKDAGAALSSDIWWNADTYGYGGSALGPAFLGASSISTLDVLDRMIDWIEARYPNVQRIVLAGHSLGAQLIQRYAYLRKDGQPTRTRLDFVIMNPGTWAFPLRTRPRAVNATACPNFDTWPFGLSASADPATVPPYTRSDLARLGRKGLITRLATRNTHILLGSEDNGSGTDRCEALVQGSSRRLRGRFYVEGVVNATGKRAAYDAAGGRARYASSVPRGQAGLPSKWTYDIVPGCSHDQECMYQSVSGVQRLMLDGF